MSLKMTNLKLGQNLPVNQCITLTFWSALHAALTIAGLTSLSRRSSRDVTASCNMNLKAFSSRWLSWPISNRLASRKPRSAWLHSDRICNTEYFHDYVIKWKHFPRYWPFVRGIHRSPVNSPHKGQWLGALIFSLICALNKGFSKQSWVWWFEMQSPSLWCHFNVKKVQQLPHWHIEDLTIFRYIIF